MTRRGCRRRARPLASAPSARRPAAEAQRRRRSRRHPSVRPHGRDGTRLYVRRAQGTSAGHRDPLRRDRLRRLHLEVPLGRPRAARRASPTGTTAATAAAVKPADPTAHRARRPRPRSRRGAPRRSATGRSCSSATRWAARSRSRRSACAARTCAASCSICGSSGRITHTFKGTNVLAQLLPRLIERVDAHPEIARAIWSRVPARDRAARSRCSPARSTRRRSIPTISLPYMKHMVDIDLPMFLRMLRSAGEHSAADLLPADRRAGAGDRRGSRHVHAAALRRGDGRGAPARASS